MQMTIVKSAYIAGGANILSESYDEACIGLKKDIAIRKIFQRVFANRLFIPTEAKRFIIYFVGEPDKKH